MEPLNLNLLVALDTFLTEGSVTGAAEAMGLSLAATSRLLGRVREALGDPIMVRAGRGMALTSRAEQLRPAVRRLVEEGRALLQPHQQSLRDAKGPFTIRSSQDITAAFAAHLHTAIHSAAPDVSLVFAPDGDDSGEALRRGAVDILIGYAAGDAPELRRQALLRGKLVAITRSEHPLAGTAIGGLEDFADIAQVAVSSRSLVRTALEEKLEQSGLSPKVEVQVPSYESAIRLVATSDLMAVVPEGVARHAIRDGARLSLLALPIESVTIVLLQIWHPRRDTDSFHRWVRSLIKSRALDIERSPG